jgi:uncharacterized membrane protein YccC
MTSPTISENPQLEARWSEWLAHAAKATAPALLFGLRLWASVCLALYIAFWLELDNAYWAGTSAAIVCQPQLGASLRKGWFRLLGTVVGAVAAVIMTACFPQDRVAFLTVLALWGAACAVVATLLRNFASYAAALAGYTAAIIASDQLGAVGGLNGQAFTLAIARASEICIGIICAGVVLGLTDLGGSRRRLALTFAQLATEVASRFARTLALADANFFETQDIRRALVGRMIALDPVIDQSLGESSQLRYYSSLLQRAYYALFVTAAAWRSAAVVLSRLPQTRAAEEASIVLARVPTELRPSLETGAAARWVEYPETLGKTAAATYGTLRALPAQTPSLRLLADQAAEFYAALSRTLAGLTLLVAHSPRSIRDTGGMRRPRVPDWLPALVNGGRAFVTIGAVMLFWIISSWPSGALAITFAAVGVILLAPRADQAYAAAMLFMVVTLVATALAAVIAFAVLPRMDGFAEFCLAIGLVLVPAGIGMAQPYGTVIFTAAAANFIPVLAPTNEMTYDTVKFYNNALAIVTGLGVAAFSFTLLPPLSPGYRARRLLAAGLRDLRRLILRPRGRTVEAWESRGHGRLSALPDQATPLQRAQLVALLTVGSQIIELRRTIGPALCRDLDAALAALVRQGVVPAVERLGNVDGTLAADEVPTALRARAGILAISDALTQHAQFFAMSATA